jgi:hypothetical protein
MVSQKNNITKKCGDYNGSLLIFFYNAHPRMLVCLSTITIIMW